MPTEVKGAFEARKALRKFAPDLGKEVQKEMTSLLKPITAKAKGFIPSTILSSWSKPEASAVAYRQFPRYDYAEARGGIGYRTAPSKPNNKGFRALARIVNASAAGAIYETAGRLNPQGRPQGPIVDNYKNGVYGKQRHSGKEYSQSLNPNAGKQFIDAINGTGKIVDANNMTGAGRRSRKMRGRAIFRAWAEDGGKTNAAILKALKTSIDKFEFVKTGRRG
jgi:hypothetical protein